MSTTPIKREDVALADDLIVVRRYELERTINTLCSCGGRGPDDDTCGLLVCHSCMDDGYCCDRRAEIETEGKPKPGQQVMFEEKT